MTVPTDPNAMVEPCCVSPAKEYRKQMAGSSDATELHKPSQEALPTWQEVESKFQQLRTDLAAALKKAAEAHEGEASERHRPRSVSLMSVLVKLPMLLTKSELLSKNK